MPGLSQSRRQKVVRRAAANEQGEAERRAELEPACRVFWHRRFAEAGEATFNERRFAGQEGESCC